MINIQQVTANAETTERLRRHLDVANVPHEWHDRVIAACQACGLLASSGSKEVNASASTGSRLDKIAAAAETPEGKAKLQLAMGQLRRLGLSLENALDYKTLNDAIRGLGEVSDRFRARAVLHAAGICD